MRTQIRRYGMAGAGRQAPYLLKACLELVQDGVEVSAICDTREDAARERAKQFGISGVFSGENAFEQMLAAGGLDGVFIVTPHATHAPFAIKAMQAGLDVYCEKPMADTLQGCLEMVRASQQYKRTLAVGYLYSNWAGWAGPVVATTIGAVRGARLRWTRADDIQPKEFYLGPGSGVLRDLFCHQWTMLYPVIQCRPIRVKASGSRAAVQARYGPEAVGYDSISAEVECEDGIIIKIESSHADRGPAKEEIKMSIYGEAGQLDYRFPGGRKDVEALRPVIRPNGGPAWLGQAPDTYEQVAPRYIGNWHLAAQGRAALMLPPDAALEPECLCQATADALETGGWVQVPSFSAS